MPIKIPNHLPARAALEAEGVMVLDEGEAVRQDIRPMRVAVLNLMPLKQRTELQLARLIGATPLQVDLTLLTTASYQGNNVSADHLSLFYKTFAQVENQRFDGLIITGAPVEHLAFDKVAYWEELVTILEWATTNVFASLGICWAAQAMLYHEFGIEKFHCQEKLFGVFPHRIVQPSHPLVRGFDDRLAIPVSRHTRTRTEDIAKIPELVTIIDSEDAGLCLLEDPRNRRVLMFNHLEYDAMTLGDEYRRDQERGQTIAMPSNYFPDDNPSQPPMNHWRAHAHLFFGNWLNLTYQATPFDLHDLGDLRDLSALAPTTQSAQLA